ncbi:hypothetical protein ACFL09_00705 [Planctomycetota bacterium]
MSRLVLSQVDELLGGQGFVVLAKNSTDPSPHGEFEAWAYKGALDFEAATPICFGIGTHSIAALRALNELLAQSTPAGLPPPKLTPLPISKRELATILAALRFHQAENLQSTDEIADDAIRDIATDSGMLEPLSPDEIDELCEQLNLGQSVPSVAQRIHDLLYLDTEKGREFYNPAKIRDADLIDVVADIVADYIPRPA